ncbi:MAG: 30S ribosomal protein S6 [Nitrospinales bacterium]
MRTYQTVLILKPDADEAQVDLIHDKVGAYISKDGGAILRTDKWGKKRLAYKVKKNRFGIYLNIFHTCNPLKIRDLEKEFGLDESIIKYLVIRLDEKEVERMFADKPPEEAPAAESGNGNSSDPAPASSKEPDDPVEKEAADAKL